MNAGENIVSNQVLINGKRAEGGLPPRTLFYGEGVFETFRYRHGLPVFFDKHCGRMKQGAEVLGIPAPGVSRIEDFVKKAVSESGYTDAYVKVCLLSEGGARFYDPPEGGSVLVAVTGYTVSEGPLKACVSSFRRSSVSPLAGIKSMNYLENVLARRAAVASGFDEALFLNERGEIAEGSASNVFWVKGRVLYTPSLDCGVLPGITRAVLLDSASQLGLEAEEGRYFLRDLIGSEFAFLTNSLMGSLPVSHLDGSGFPAGHTVYEGVKRLLLKKLKWD